MSASASPKPALDPAHGLMTEAETEVYCLLRKYRVRQHYLATSAAKAPRYAVFAVGAGQITEPTSSAEAHAEAAALTARDIVATLGRSGAA